MNEKILDELQKLYDNNKIGALVQEICEYYATKGGYEDGSYEDEIEPPEIVESAYILFCLQCREQILDEFSIVRKKYPELYTCVSELHSTLLVNMDYRSLEEKSALAISQHVPDTSIEDILSQVETSVRSSESLLEAIDKFYKWLHTRSR
ncbi:hypothetical protein [Butyrivibrio sp. AE2032]|uniref:hypothetical protein n=1 Tax=Butyrivibrio sp. AE2032 TaxID=1458463 RepID=UPI00054FB21A|nr:hypothetical protein [Butyrivibrio sp. AE2032]